MSSVLKFMLHNVTPVHNTGVTYAALFVCAALPLKSSISESSFLLWLHCESLFLPCHTLGGHTVLLGVFLFSTDSLQKCSNKMCFHSSTLVVQVCRHVDSFISIFHQSCDIRWSYDALKRNLKGFYTKHILGVPAETESKRIMCFITTMLPILQFKPFTAVHSQ